MNSQKQVMPKCLRKNFLYIHNLMKIIFCFAVTSNPGCNRASTHYFLSPVNSDRFLAEIVYIPCFSRVKMISETLALASALSFAIGNILVRKGLIRHQSIYSAPYTFAAATAIL